MKPSNKKANKKVEQKQHTGLTLKLEHAELQNRKGLEKQKTDPVHAIADFTRALLLVPEEPSYYWHRAESYLLISDIDSCLANFRQILSIVESPFIQARFASISFLSAQLYLDQGRYQEALKALQVCQEYHFQPKECLIRIALTKIALDQLDSALEDLSSLIDTFPCLELYILRAKIYYFKKNPRMVQLDLEKAKELDPHHPDVAELVRYVLSVAVDLKNGAAEYIIKQELNLALELLHKAIELDPEDLNLLVSRGAVLAELGQFQQGLQDLLLVSNKGIPVHSHIASVYNRMGIRTFATNVDDAISFFTLALDYNKEAVIYKNRADCFYMSRMFRQSLQDLNSAKELQPNDDEINHKIGLVYSALGAQSIAAGDLQEALEHLNTAIRYEKKADYYYDRARAYYYLENIEAAQQDLSLVLEMDPHHTAAESMLSLMMSATLNDLAPMHSRKPLKKNHVFTMAALANPPLKPTTQESVLPDVPSLRLSQGGPNPLLLHRHDLIKVKDKHIERPKKADPVLHKVNFETSLPPLPKIETIVYQQKELNEAFKRVEKEKVVHSVVLELKK